MNHHKCPIVGCSHNLPKHILMCPGHWAMVPWALKRKVYAAWNHGNPASDYLFVRQAAIDSVEAKQR